jgi:hypothetical protein
MSLKRPSLNASSSQPTRILREVFGHLSPHPNNRALEIPAGMGQTEMIRSGSSLNNSTTSASPEPVAVSPTPVISDLCEAIGTATSQTLELSNVLGWDSQEYRINLLKVESLTEDIYVSLKQLLDEQRKLGRKDRLQLSVTLASSLLQLHETAWLSKDWNKSSVLFELQRTQNETNDVCVNKPFVSYSFPLPAHQVTLEDTARPNLKGPGYRNQSVFALGILLIELWFGSSLEKLRIKSDMGVDEIPNPITDLVTARRLLEDVYSEAGDWYGDAVRRCIFCEFDQRHTSLDNATFKDAVDRGVIQPLVNHLSSFSGKIPIPSGWDSHKSFG